MFKFFECRHILPTGRKCHAPALRGKSYCHHHTKLHFRRWGSREPRMSTKVTLDDPHSLQVAVEEALNALRSPRIDSKKAAVSLYGLQLAASLSHRNSTSPPRRTTESVSGLRPHHDTEQANSAHCHGTTDG